MNQSLTVTNIINQLLDEEKAQEITTPEDALNALECDFFESPHQCLTRVLCKLLGKENEKDVKDCLSINYQKLLSENGEDDKAKNARICVTRWLKGERIPERDSAFKICFSLQQELGDIENIKELLRHGFRMSSFNPRSATECIYFYCFASNKTYSDALKILDIYNTSEIPENVDENIRIQSSGSGQTTFLIYCRLKENEWDTEESFINFLLVNKDLFINSSNTFIREYSSVYDELSGKIISYNNEILDAKIKFCKDHDSKKLAQAVFSKDKYIKSFGGERIKNLKTEYMNLSKEAKNGKHLGDCDLAFFCEDNADEIYDLWESEIKPYCFADTTAISDTQMSMFLERGIPQIKHLSRNSNYNNGKKRKSPNADLNEITPSETAILITDSFNEYSSSKKISDSVLSKIQKEALDGFSFKNLIGDLRKIINSQNINRDVNISKYRKLFLMVYCYNYIFDLVWGSDPCIQPSASFFNNFVNGITETLDKCNLSPLSKSNFFDWLILETVRAAEKDWWKKTNREPHEDLTWLNEYLDAEASEIDDFTDDEETSEIEDFMDDADISLRLLRDAPDGFIDYLCDSAEKSRDICCGTVRQRRDELIKLIEECAETDSDPLYTSLKIDLGSIIDDYIKEKSNIRTCDEIRKELYEEDKLSFFGEVLKLSFAEE